MFSTSPPADPVPDDQWVTVAQLTRTRGNRGELAAISLTSQPERFQKLVEVLLVGGRGHPDESRFYRVEEVWEHSGRPIFKFQGIDSISEAEPLAGASVRVRLSERMPLPEGEFYLADLVGCDVVERQTSEVLGTVTDWLDAGGAGNLEVTLRKSGEKMLIPFAKAICVNIDVPGRSITVDLPEGLMDLHA